MQPLFTIVFMTFDQAKQQQNVANVDLIVRL